MTIDDPHTPLRQDIKLLGYLLGETLQELEGEALFERVEEVRVLSKGACAGRAEAGALLEQVMSEMPEDEAITVARVFAHFLALVNIAEQYHRVRRRQHALDEGAPQRGSLPEGLQRLLDAGVSPEDLWVTATEMRVDLVMTAHPTQAARRTLLRKYATITALLERRDRIHLTPQEEGDLIDALRREIAAVWRTDEIRQTKPTPLDEVRSGLVPFEQVLWDAVPDFLRLLDRELVQRTGKGLPLHAVPVRFGSWMGGDRDRDPNVTSELTRRAVAMARQRAAALYRDALSTLYDELSMNQASDELLAEVGEQWEPYRALLRPVRERLERTRLWAQAIAMGEPPPYAADEVYTDVVELAAPLLLCDRSLRACGDDVVADGRLMDVLRRLPAFGLVLAPLDIRQEADRHTEALDAITTHLRLGRYSSWSEAERIGFLIRELNNRRPLIPQALWDGTADDLSPEVVDVLQTFAMAAQQLPGSLGAYVVAMAARPSDVLAVEMLQREARQRFNAQAAPLRVVPLFETWDDLTAAGRVMHELFINPWYRQYIATTHTDRQEVMIGHSESAKDAGRLTAAWALYQCQEDLVRVCQQHGISLTLFHGRGGAVGRGGRPAHAAIRSQPPGAVDGTLRVIEQGEVIQAKFGAAGLAAQTLELYATAVLEATLMPPMKPKPEWRVAMDSLSERARKAYRRTLHEDGFVTYFRTATLEPELVALNIGSRPARRRAGGGGIASLRAIPWGLAWMQIRLNLPVWLGVGAALEAALREPHEEHLLAEMVDQWSFWRSTLEMIEMVLAKAEPGVAARYDAALVDGTLAATGEELRTRLERTRAAVMKALKRERLLETNPDLSRSIAVRSPYVDPLNLVQAALLKRSRESNDPRLLRALMVTVHGIAAGMRNTG
ncbi:MAG: phosphoenolpyruvate carboxylase [Myxococcota bacterium]